MDNVKVSLTVILKDSNTVNAVNPSAKVKGKKEKKNFKDKERIEHNDGKNITTAYSCFPTVFKARQVINITREAYDYMVSNNCPVFSSKGLWAKLSKKNRLEAHMKLYCEYLNGESYHYNILDD